MIAEPKKEKNLGRGSPDPVCTSAFNKILPTDDEMHDVYGTGLDGYPNGVIADYGGLFALKEDVARMEGVSDPNCVVITQGSQHFFSRFMSLLRHRLGPVGVGTNVFAYDRHLEEGEGEDHEVIGLSSVDGIDLKEAKKTLQRYSGQVKVIVLVVPGNNPSGHTPTVEHIMSIADFCSERGIFLLLDQAYKEFAYREPLALPFDDPVFRSTIRVFSFSKTGKPDLLIGGGILPNTEMAEAMKKKVASSNIGRNMMNQAKLSRVIRNGKYADHVADIVPYYGKKAREFNRAVAKDLPNERLVEEIRDGFFGTLLFRGVPFKKLFSKALERGVRIANGEVFVPKNLRPLFMEDSIVRVSFASFALQEISEITGALAEACAEVRSQ